MVMTAYASAVCAEGGCPPGQYPTRGQGWQGCTPPANASPAAGPKWVNQWMAIAADMQKQRLGTSLHDVSEESTKTGAIVDCKRHGGQNCEIQITVRNGCAAMVAGAKSTYVQAADRQDDAETGALMQCKADDTQCMKLYSGCSPPIQVE